MNNEVFTPKELVNVILDFIGDDVWLDPNKTWLDPSCGNGNFLVAVKERLLEHGHSVENVLSRIYGIDIVQDSVDECRRRLDPNNEYPEIVQKNIVCTDSLTYDYSFGRQKTAAEELNAPDESRDLWQKQKA